MVLGFLLRALIASLFLSVLASLVGSHVIFRRDELLLIGATHAALAGAAFALLMRIYVHLRVGVLIGALAFALAFTLPVTLREGEKERLAGILFALFMSFAFLFLSLMREYASEAWGLIVGDILLLTTSDVITLSLCASFIILPLILAHRRFVYIAFDPEGAEVLGINVRLYNAVYAVILATTCVLAVSTVGLLLVYVIMLIPPAVARRLVAGATPTLILSLVIALTSSMLGLGLGLVVPVPPSALTGLILATLYAVSELIISRLRTPR